MSLVLEATLNLKTSLVIQTQVFETGKGDEGLQPPPSDGNYVIFRAKRS